jgi:hypothetical protein
MLLLGVLLRLGLPLAVTAWAVWVLRRLDARWQAEAKSIRMPLPAAPVPCWDVRRCSAERRAACPAYARPDTPCWQVFRDPQGRLKDDCLDCEVFRGAPVPSPAQS